MDAMHARVLTLHATETTLESKLDPSLDLVNKGGACQPAA